MGWDELIFCKLETWKWTFVNCQLLHSNAGTQYYISELVVTLNTNCRACGKSSYANHPVNPWRRGGQSTKVKGTCMHLPERLWNVLKVAVLCEWGTIKSRTTSSKRLNNEWWRCITKSQQKLGWEMLHHHNWIEIGAQYLQATDTRVLNSAVANNARGRGELVQIILCWWWVY